MEFIVHKDLNEILEISGLIPLALYPSLKNDWYQDFVSHGYGYILEILKKYVETFSENFVSSADDFLFFESDGFGVRYQLQMMLIRHSDWLTNLDELGDMKKILHFLLGILLSYVV